MAPSPRIRFTSKLPFAILLAVALAAGVTVFALRFERAAAPPVTFVSLTGERIAMSGLRGKVVLVEFWATDCATCVKEMPQLVQTYEKYRAQGFEAIAVAMKYDPPNYVIAYAKRNGLPFTVALDPTGELAKAFGEVKLTPTTFLIDKQGRIGARMLGERDFARLHALIEERLKDPV
jgi:peroxiredoxin